MQKKDLCITENGISHKKDLSNMYNRVDHIPRNVH